MKNTVSNTFFSELMVNPLNVKIVPISSYVVMNITDLNEIPLKYSGRSL